MIFFFLPGIHCHAQQNAKDTLRACVFELNTDSRKAAGLLSTLETIDSPGPTILAYEAACKAHMAKICKNIFRKYALIRASNSDLQLAIYRDGSNPEIRFLRYAIQVQTPGILGFSNNMDEDKQIMLATLHTFPWNTLDDGVLDYIVDFMNQYGHLSQVEAQYMRRQLAHR